VFIASLFDGLLCVDQWSQSLCGAFDFVVIPTFESDHHIVFQFFFVSVDVWITANFNIWTEFSFNSFQIFSQISFQNIRVQRLHVFSSSFTSPLSFVGFQHLFKYPWNSRQHKDIFIDAADGNPQSRSEYESTWTGNCCHSEARVVDGIGVCGEQFHLVDDGLVWEELEVECMGDGLVCDVVESGSDSTGCKEVSVC